jgi:hypothetical protein
MADATGAGPKKETVYGGPTPENPWAGGAAAKPAAQPSGTVFDESKFVAKKTDNTVARVATTHKVRRQTIRFFIVATLSFVEVLIYWSSDPLFAFSAGVVCGVFLTIGIFAYRLSRTAFYIGTGIYLLDTLFLFYLAFFTDFGFVFWAEPLIIHSLIVYRLWVAIGHLNELLAED